MFLSQRTLNSAMHTLHSMDMLEVSEKKASSTYLKTFFSNFEEVFGHHENIKMTFKSLSVPKIEITET